MIVVAIVAVLAAIAIPAYQGYISTSKEKSAETTLEQFSILLESYRAENGSFPPSGVVYRYIENADGTINTDTITPLLPDFRPRSAAYPADKGILFDYSLSISNSGTATESAAFSATGVRDGTGIVVNGTYN
jgi:type II secretory pathway pseudopilin PulG